MEKEQLPQSSWDQFEKQLDEPFLEKIQDNFEYMTYLQKEVINFFFDDERAELQKKEMGAFVIAPAGNGKTLTFLIPAMKFINFQEPVVVTTKEKGRDKGRQIEFDFHVILPQVVIIIDTQSLVDQIEEVIISITPTTGKWKDLIVQKIYKGINLHEQVDSQGKIRGCHILISTPDLLNAKVNNSRKFPQYPTRVSLDNCKFLAIDEAEQVIRNHEQQIELLIKGSEDLIKNGIRPARENDKLNICLASATLDKRTRDSFKQLWFSDTEFRSFKIELKLDGVFSYAKQLKSNEINEAYDEVINILKLMIIDKKLNTQVMVFMDEIEFINKFEDKLKQEVGDSIKYNSYHSKKDNKDKILQEFRSGQFEVLFTTNVLARGIDIRKVSLVINIFAPRDQRFKDGQKVYNMDAKIYMHRVGRTGRFADQGVAITLLRGYDKKYEPVQDNKLEEKLIEFVTNFKLQEETIEAENFADKRKQQDQMRNNIRSELQKSDNLKLRMIDNYEEMVDKIQVVIKNNAENKVKKEVKIIMQKEKVGNLEEQKIDD